MSENDVAKDEARVQALQAQGGELLASGRFKNVRLNGEGTGLEVKRWVDEDPTQQWQPFRG